MKIKDRFTFKQDEAVGYNSWVLRKAVHDLSEIEAWLTDALLLRFLHEPGIAFFNLREHGMWVYVEGVDGKTFRYKDRDIFKIWTEYKGNKIYIQHEYYGPGDDLQ